MDVNNQGLNLPSNLQNLDVRNELLSSELGSDAFCAYSLRDLTGSNKNVVRVRRMPHDVGDADGAGGNADTSPNDERNFGGQEVQAGYVADWVNGKLENTLPCDVATASAGYSLRKIKSSYSDNAVRIRRDSDGIEVNVAFDSDDKVSASSLVTDTTEQGGEIGSTTATDLNGFLNEKFTVGTAVNGTSSADHYTLTNPTTTGFSADNSSGGGIGSAGFPYLFGTGDIIVVKYTVSNFNNTSGTLSPQIRGVVSSNIVTSSTSGGTIVTSNGTYTDTLTASGDGTLLMFADSHYGSYTISDFQIVSHAHSAFVHTWYDQAGSNDAVQATSANQPKIAESGALLADGLDFDGTNDFLQSSTQVLTGTETGANSMYAVIKQTTGDAGYICGSASSQSGADFVGQSLYGKNVNSVFVLSNGNNIDEPERDNITITQNSIVLVSANYSNNNTDTLKKNANNNGYANGTSTYDFNAGSKFTIGARDGSTATAVMFNGTIKEVIAYDSDQSDNRFKIESNINNYYGLYNDANELTQSTWQNDGSEGDFSSTSVDGFTFQNSANSAFIGVTLSDTLELNDSVFVSFNATGVTHPGSTDQSPQLRLRDGVGSGSSGTSDVNHVINGFNSFTLTYNTGSSGQHIVFSEGNTGGGSVTISNFKVSRLSRNGFVETWYDQSTNGVDVSQLTASNQPKIVLNGGQDSQGIHFDQDQSLSRSDAGTPVQTSAFFTFVATRDENTVRPTLAGNTADIAWNTDDNFMLRANSNNTRTTSTTAMDTDRHEEYLLSVSVNSSRVPKFYINENTETEPALTEDVGSTFKIIGGDTGVNSTFGLNGRINEAIAFNGDKTSKVDEIRAEQNNYYNIY